MQLYASRASDSGTITRVEVLRKPEGNALVRHHLTNGRTFEWSVRSTPEDWVRLNSGKGRTQDWNFA